MISCYTFFFRKKIACSSSVSTFMAKALNSIMKSTVFHFPCLKILIFHSASAIFVLSLNIVLISLMNFFQFWVPNSLSSSSNFLYTYMPATPSLRYARIAVILSLVSMTLLLLRNNHIPLHQSLNFVLSPLNYLGSETMFLGITAYLFVFIVTGTSATDITSSDCSIILSEVSFVICKDPSYSNSVSMSSVLLELV